MMTIDGLRKLLARYIAQVWLDDPAGIEAEIENFLAWVARLEPDDYD